MALESGPSGESLSRFNHTRKWADLVRLGLFPDVKSLEEYDTRFFSNIIATHHLLTRTSQTFTIPSPDEVRAIHHAVFMNIHPWAGCFRSKALGIGGRLGADHTTLIANLELAQAEAEVLLQSRDWSVVQVAAFYHVRFELIHPFRDGNGRVGRLILASQIKNMAGLDMHPPVHAREQYLDCLDYAAWCGKLRPLVRLIKAWCGIAPDERSERDQLYSPYKLGPRFLNSGESLATLDEELEKALISPIEWDQRARKYPPLRPLTRDVR